MANSEVVSLSKKEARKIILSAQALNKNAPFGSGPESVIRAIEHLGYVQIDTLSVVERAHHHVLWTRIPAHTLPWLEKAQYKSRRVFEYWSHAAAYLPMKDYRYSIPVMNLFRDQKDRWPKSQTAELKKVLELVRNEGPVQSRDFESDHKGGTWWDYKPQKWALQRLYLEGHLMVSHREGFQRVYDLPERILPTDIDTSTPTRQEYYRHLILQTLKAQGIASRKALFHLRQIDHPDFDLVLSQLLEDESIKAIKVGALKEMYALSESLDQTIRIPDRFVFLSPFDNMIIWRQRLKDIFGYDYTLECYIPEAKRVYGYFCLPMLRKDEIVGRIDLKADRKAKVLRVKKVFWTNEKTRGNSNELYRDALDRFATFNLCEEVKGW